jgi:hypothetical protein
VEKVKIGEDNNVKEKKKKKQNKDNISKSKGKIGGKEKSQSRRS